jgi:hypothetical protein
MLKNISHDFYVVYGAGNRMFGESLELRGNPDKAQPHPGKRAECSPHTDFLPEGEGNQKQKPALWAGSLNSGARTREYSVTYQFDIYQKFFCYLLSRPRG